MGKFIDRTGEIRTANNGQIMTIINCRNSRDIDIKFEDGTIVKNKHYLAFLNGKIQNPNNQKKK